MKTRYRILGGAFVECYGIVYKNIGDKVKIVRIFVPQKNKSMWDIVEASFPDAVPEDDEAVEKLVARIQKYFKGYKVRFALDLLDLSVCSPFQLEVLAIIIKIPYGKVASYGWVAKQLGKNCSRLVGTMLAQNPFPIIFPCHRVIKSNRDIGEYQAGRDIKRRMLEMEGVKLDLTRKVAIENFLSNKG